MAEIRVKVVTADLKPVMAILKAATELTTAWARMTPALRESIGLADPVFACHLESLTHSLLEMKGAR